MFGQKCVCVWPEDTQQTGECVFTVPTWAAIGQDCKVI